MSTSRSTASHAETHRNPSDSGPEPTLRDLIRVLEQRRIDAEERHRQIEELTTSLKRLTLQVQNCERQLSLSPSLRPNRRPLPLESKPPSRTTTRDLVQITGPASSQKPTPFPARNPTETPPTHLRPQFDVIYDSSSDDDAPFPPRKPSRAPPAPIDSDESDDSPVDQEYCPACGQGLDDVEDASGSELLRDGYGSEEQIEDLGEVEDTEDLEGVEDAEGDEGVDYDYDSEPFQEGPESEYAEGVEEVDYESGPYLEGSEVEAEDIEGVEYAYDSEQYLEGPEVNEEVDEEADGADYVDYDYDYDSEPLRQGYGSGGEKEVGG